MTQILFEGFNVPGLYVAPQPVLSLYASGLTTGLVLNSGYGTTYAIPIFEGYSLHHSLVSVNVSGSNLNEYLAKQLIARGSFGKGATPWDVVEKIKKRNCYVALDFEGESKQFESSPSEEKFQLPDGAVLSLGQEQFRTPEAMFNPTLLGQAKDAASVQSAILAAIKKSDSEIQSSLYENVVLAGGNTLFEEFPTRLAKELASKAPAEAKVRIIAPENRIYSAWLGGAMLASQAAFAQMWITRQRYEECGSRIVHEKCF